MMKHAKPNKDFNERFKETVKKENFKNALPIIFVSIILALAMIFAVLSLYEYANSGFSGYEEKPYFSVEPWTMGVELVTEGPEPTYPTYFTYNTEETETNG